MMRLLVRWAVALVLFPCGVAWASEPSPRAGIEYQSSDIQAMQNDDFQNPGMLAVDAGQQLMHASDNPAGLSCLHCHDDFSGVARQYPKINARINKLVSLGEQIQVCRVDHQQGQAWVYESEPVLALAAAIAFQSRGQAFAPLTEDFDQALAEGKAYYYQRKGQLNLACAHCHEQNHGRMLRGDLISQGVSTGYPIYRLEWQQVGSLHRRFRACDIGVRAEPEKIGGPVYTALELYLRVRAGDLPITAPAVRR